MLLDIYSQCPVYGLIPNSEAFKLMSENCNLWNNLIGKVNQIQKAVQATSTNMRNE